MKKKIADSKCPFCGMDNQMIDKSGNIFQCLTTFSLWTNSYHRSSACLKIEKLQKQIDKQISKKGYPI
jgi:Zn ribbon nucleic-acid-binding protein